MRTPVQHATAPSFPGIRREVLSALKIRQCQQWQSANGFYGYLSSTTNKLLVLIGRTALEIRYTEGNLAGGQRKRVQFVPMEIDARAGSNCRATVKR